MGRSADPALQPAPLAGLDETANAEILGQFVPSLATMPEIQVQRNARVIQVRKRDLPRSWDALPLAASEMSRRSQPVGHGEGRRTLAREEPPRGTERYN